MPNILIPGAAPGKPPVTLLDARLVVFIGSNGAGKTRLGHWIDERSPGSTHRISAQRMIHLPSAFTPKSEEAAQVDLRIGFFAPNQRRLPASKFTSRFVNDPIVGQVSDFEKVMDLLFAEQRARDRSYVGEAQRNPGKAGVPPECALDKIAGIWARLFPGRVISFGADRITISAGGAPPYDARDLSDGERAALYLSAQALGAEPGSVLIIDEPEVHLHRALQASLWDAVENAREDCAFIYITHDVEFAASRRAADKIWVRAYEPAGWTWERVADPAAEDALILRLLGSRRDVLFVEGKEGSLDVQLYRALFPSLAVVPRGSCTSVRDSTASMRALAQLHHLKPLGIVDADRRSPEEVRHLAAAGVGVAAVAEVENAFCVEAVFKHVGSALALSDVPDRWLRFADLAKAKLVAAADDEARGRTVARIQYRLGSFATSKGAQDVKQEFDAHIAGIDVSAILADETASVRKAASSGHAAVLQYLNDKSLLGQAAGSLDTSRDTYVRLALREVGEDPLGQVAQSLRSLFSLPPT